MPSEYIGSMEGKSADCDSMILISLCYGKQVAVSEARAEKNPHLRMELQARLLMMKSC